MAINREMIEAMLVDFKKEKNREAELILIHPSSSATLIRSLTGSTNYGGIMAPDFKMIVKGVPIKRSYDVLEGTTEIY